MDELSHLDIDLSAIGHNLGVIRRIVGDDCMICPVVKSDAYGLGLHRVAGTLETGGADMFAVYSPGEAVELVATGCRIPILVLMPVRGLSMVDPMLPGLRTGQVHLVIHDVDNLDLLESFAEEFDILLHVHLKLNTGMHRGGCEPGDAANLLERIMDCPRLHLAGICTHFSSSSTCRATTDGQMERFDAFIDANMELIDSDCLVHCATTASLNFGERYARSMVRVGLGWAGASPNPTMDDAVTGLSPVLRWRSRIVQTRSVAAGQPVGYDGDWCPDRDSTIGIVPVGYVDGYPAPPRDHLQSSTPLVVGLLNQDRVIGHATVVGKVSMDQITIDLTDACTGGLAGSFGQVELLSNVQGAPNDIQGLATAAATKPHAIIARLHPRIRRVIHGEVPQVTVFSTSDQVHNGASAV